MPIVLNGGYLQIGANVDDYFPIEGARVTAEELKRLFDIAGLAKHVRLAESQHGHGWNKEVYEHLYAFLNVAFDRPTASAEHTATHKDTRAWKELWCTANGQVTANPLASETVVSLGRAKAERLRQRRATRRRALDVLAAARRRCILPSLPAEVIAEPCGRTVYQGIAVEKWLIDADPGIRLPALLIGSDGARRRPRARAWVFASPLGKQAAFQADRFPLRQALAAGDVVLAVDVRGWGETRWLEDLPKGTRRLQDYTATISGQETILSYNALRNRHTMVGQWAYDLLASAHWLRRQGSAQAIILWGHDRLGVAALHALAAGQNERLDAVLHETLWSYHEWACTEHDDVPPSLVIPGILEDYDLPELAAAVGGSRPPGGQDGW